MKTGRNWIQKSFKNSASDDSSAQTRGTSETTRANARLVLFMLILGTSVFASQAIAQPGGAEVSQEERNKRLEEALKKRLQEAKENPGQAQYFGGQGMGGGKIPAPEVLAYQHQVQKHVKSQFSWKSNGPKLVAKVIVDVAPDGKLGKVELYKTSGDPAFDQAAVQTLQKSNPLPAPPSKYYANFKQVIFTLDSEER